MSQKVASEPIVTITDKAARQIRQLIDGDPANQGKGLRIYVEGGGCSGMQYGMLFDQKQTEDLSSEAGGVSVIVDPTSAENLRGAVIDFSDGLTNAGFKISNPNARQSCGCGKSFSC
jgi:iron-sulfur cluster assembly protein/iron-sulfur cluster insertion protein